MSKIKIGLNLCPVTERVGAKGCYRCWKHGHKGSECKELQDSSKACRRCGKSGHQQKGCQGNMLCLTCKVEGHSTGSGRCPEFKKALRRARLKSKKRKSY